MTVKPVEVFVPLERKAPRPLIAIRPGRIEGGHPLDVDLGPSPPNGFHVATVKRDYHAGAIATVDELERRLEHALLLDSPRDHPVPEGWEPLPPCDHDWIDISTLGQQARERICSGCGERQFE